MCQLINKRLNFLIKKINCLVVGISYYKNKLRKYLILMIFVKYLIKLWKSLYDKDKYKIQLLFNIKLIMFNISSSQKYIRI